MSIHNPSATKLGTAVLLGCLSTVASAEININGFATIAVGSTFESDPPDTFNQETYGYDNELSFKTESLFAVQVTNDFGDGLSATAQIIARGAEDFDAEFSWAYMSYDFSEQSNLKMGRLRIPFYSYSEFLEVGYSYHWIRPPQSAYTFIFSDLDGMSYTYNGTLGSWDSSLQFTYGRFTGTTNPFANMEAESDLRDITSAVWTLSLDEWTFRMGSTRCGDCQVELSFVDPFGNLADDLVAAGYQGVLERMAFEEGDDGIFYDFSAKYDAIDWFIEAEAVKIQVDDALISDYRAGYVSVGVRTGDYVWHVTAEREDARPKSDIYAGISDPLLQARVKGWIDATEDKNNRYTIGMRYNFHPSAAFKLEYHTIRSELSDMRDDGIDYDSRVISAAVDLIF